MTILKSKSSVAILCWILLTVSYVAVVHFGLLITLFALGRWIDGFHNEIWGSYMVASQLLLLLGMRFERLVVFFPLVLAPAIGVVSLSLLIYIIVYFRFGGGFGSLLVNSLPCIWLLSLYFTLVRASLKERKLNSPYIFVAAMIVGLLPIAYRFSNILAGLP